LIRYFDAGALVKRYVREAESALVRRLLTESLPVTSRLSMTEIASAVVRRCREGAFPATERDRALAALQNDFRSLYVAELTPDVSALSVTLLVRYQLRAGDAVQLASCLYLQQRLGRPVQFVAYDTRLAEAARQEALTLIP
jgi:predicted nucleic acid-binding protein